MITFQDFEQAQNKREFVFNAIARHQCSAEYEIALTANLYDRQKNKTINDYVRTIYTISGAEIEDFTATNSKIASNFFHRLNTQRCTYSLGNGISFANDDDNVLKKKLGDKFDSRLYDVGYYALIHGVAFGFWNGEKLHVFELTEFVPLWDENDGTLKAGIRFWRIDPSKPMIAVLYEIDGYTKFKRTQDGDDYKFSTAESKQPYKITVRQNPAGDVEVIGEENYSTLPIVPLYGSRLKQSTLVGMQSAIDSFDLIRSGFANDLSDCTQIYWLIENAGGMDNDDLARFRDKLKLQHIAEVDTNDGTKVTPYTQEIPYQARQSYLKDIRTGIYEDFGGLDVHQVDASSTNDHLEAAYQPMDENADDFEYQLIEFIQQILVIAGLPLDMPVFKRNRISNTKEQVDMVMLEAAYLDEQTILKKLPNITPDEVKEIMNRMQQEDQNRLGGGKEEEETEEVTEE